MGALDLKHSVKRHIVVKRVLPEKDFPTEMVKTAKAKQSVENKKKRENTKSLDDTIEKIKKAKREAKQAKRSKWTDQAEYHALHKLLSFDFSIHVCSLYYT